MNASKCQMECTYTMQESRPEPVPISISRRLRLMIVRRMSPNLKHLIKKNLKRFTKWQERKSHPAGIIQQVDTKHATTLLNSGDVVQIRSINEIRATLDSNSRLKGCRFMPEMEQYCETVQRVFKPVERYLNECDFTVRKSKGLVLLENLFCQGVAEAGRCDRACFYFWRVEWLEVVNRTP
jgi:hypothetical protein